MYTYTQHLKLFDDLIFSYKLGNVINIICERQIKSHFTRLKLHKPDRRPTNLHNLRP